MGAIILTEQSSVSTPSVGGILIANKNGNVMIKNASGFEFSLERNMYRNRIINGAMDVNQRLSGVGFVGLANGTYTFDRFRYDKAGAMVNNVLRSTDVPTVAQAGTLANYSLHIQTSTVDSSIAATDVCLLMQVVEGYNWKHLAQRPCTLSFWVKSTVTGIFCVSLSNSGGNRTCVMEYTISAADTWEYKTVTFPASPSAGTWDYTTGRGVTVSWTLAAGINYQTTGGSWQTTLISGVATSNQSNAVSSTANNFKLTLMQLEEGPVATPFEARNIKDEIQLCQRYCYVVGSDGVGVPVVAFGPVVGAGVTNSSTNAAISVQYPVPMRIRLTSVTGTASQWLAIDGTTNSAGSAFSITQSSVERARLDVTITGAAASRGVMLQGDATGGRIMIFDAEY